MADERKWNLRLGYLIHDVSRLRRVCFDRELAPLGITRSQWWVLSFIARSNGLPQTQLAHELEVGKVALVSLVDKLQAAALVDRVPDKDDRRVKRVFLTDKARKLLDEITPVSKAFNDRILAGLRQEDLDTTARTLFKMKQNLVAIAGGNHDDTGDAG